jgi:SOS-response transcriptional repressor LexA
MQQEDKKTTHVKHHSVPASEFYDYDALKAHLKATGWSYNRLAKALGIRQSSVSGWFIKRRISEESVHQVAELTGFDPALLTRSQPAVAPPQDSPKEKAGEIQELPARSAEIHEAPAIRELPICGRIAAGSAACPTDAIIFTEGGMLDHFPMAERVLPSRECVALVVEGTSMCPDFKEGDLVLVERIDDVWYLSPGDNVVVDLGNGYGPTLKQWDGKGTLRSINPSGPTFDLTQERFHEARLWGRVFMSICDRR